MRKLLEFLGFLTDGDIEWLLSSGETEELRAGETLLPAAQMLDSIFILVEGRLASIKPGEQAHGKHLGPGEVVGEISAKPAAATVTAELPSCVLRVRRADLVDKCDADEAFAKRFAQVMRSLVSRRMQRVLYEEEDETPEADTSNKDSVELDAEMLDQIALAAKKFDRIRMSG